MENSKNSQILKLFLINRFRKRMKRKKRAMSIRPIFSNRLNNGESVLVRELANDPFYHHKYFRMNKESFDEILHLMQKDLTRKQTHSRPISPLEKVGITLRYLASGNSQISLAMSYRVSPSSIGIIIREVTAGIRKYMGPVYLPTPDKETWKRNEIGFRLKWNFPNACGAIDGKHIRIQAPPVSGSTHYNYKNFFSLVLMAVAGPDYSFTYVDIGAAGSQSDGGVFGRSSIGIALNNDNLNLPNPKVVGDKHLPHVLLGDDAFALKNNLMKPFPGKFLTKNRRIFNYRLSRGRMVIENAFGILAARWRILHSPIIAELDFIKELVLAIVILHNYLIYKDDMNTITGDNISNDEIICGNWREENQLLGLSHQGTNTYPKSASVIRDEFSSFFNGAGAVAWQNSRIGFY